MPLIRLDLYRLQQMARRLGIHPGETPAERRLRKLPPVSSIQSLTEIGDARPRWVCPHCGWQNDETWADCGDCGRDREAPRRVSR